jgi:hypothetical protein
MRPGIHVTKKRRWKPARLPVRSPRVEGVPSRRVSNRKRRAATAIGAGQRRSISCVALPSCSSPATRAILRVAAGA